MEARWRTRGQAGPCNAGHGPARAGPQLLLDATCLTSSASSKGLAPTRPAGPHQAPRDDRPCLAALPRQWGPLVRASPSEQIRGSQGRETTLSPPAAAERQASWAWEAAAPGTQYPLFLDRPTQRESLSTHTTWKHKCSQNCRVPIRFFPHTNGHSVLAEQSLVFYPSLLPQQEAVQGNLKT